MTMANEAVGKDKGPSELDKQAAAGLALFASEKKFEFDTGGAEAYKSEIESTIEALKKEAAALTGKENKKAKTEKDKEASALKADKKYIDALKVLKGLDPPNGNFIKAVTGGDMPEAAPAAEVKEEPKKEEKEKKEKPKKEKAGITPEEEKELSKLKDDLIARKAELKAQGMSGGQQNKDEQVVAWVARMNELKEKQDPGSTTKKDEPKKKKGALSEADKKAFDELKQKIEDYKARCKSEFGYTNKDIKADPDCIEMEKELAEFEKRAK